MRPSKTGRVRAHQHKRKRWFFGGNPLRARVSDMRYRTYLFVLPFTLLFGCSSRPAPEPVHAEKLTADTPKATVEGNTFIAPAGWDFTVRGAATVVQAPEGDSRIALVDVHAE